MTKFEVDLVVVEERSYTIEVEATDAEHAMDVAEDLAYNSKLDRADSLDVSIVEVNIKGVFGQEVGE